MSQITVHYNLFRFRVTGSLARNLSEFTVHCNLSRFRVTDSLERNMGCSQSVEYYFGFININISHLDLLSFALGVGLTLAAQCLWTYCKNSRRAAQHILGKIPAQKGGQRAIPPAAYNGGFYPYPPAPPCPPPTVEPATAPPAPGTAVMPWKYQCSAA